MLEFEEYRKTIYKQPRNKKSSVLKLMSDPMFRARVEEKRKGKGSYNRNKTKINLNKLESFYD